MSYRLIDANAIASQLPEVNDMPCIYADLDKGLDGCHYDLRGANTLQAENAKLRGLVQKMMRFFEDGDYCTTCEKAAECDAQEEYEEDCLMRGVFHDRMRELGVEVD